MSEQKQEQAAAQQQEPQAGPEAKQPAQPQKPAAEKRAQKKGKQKKMALEVRGPVRGRWRAGRKFGPDAVVIPLEELDQAARAAIEADPLLSVREMEVEA